MLIVEGVPGGGDLPYWLFIAAVERGGCIRDPAEDASFGTREAQWFRVVGGTIRQQWIVVLEKDDRVPFMYVAEVADALGFTKGEFYLLVDQCIPPPT